MKLSRSNSQSQGENNRETYATRRSAQPSSSSTLWWSQPQSGPTELRRPPIVAKHCANRNQRACCSYENGTRTTRTLPPAASRGIVPAYRHAAGALTSLALPLGRAQRLAACPRLPDLEDAACSSSFPAFFAFAALSAVGEFALYAADVIPSVTAANFWRVDWASLLIEGLLKFRADRRRFSRTFSALCLARTSRKAPDSRRRDRPWCWQAALAAGYAPKDSPFGIISGAHLLEQTIYLIESGLLVFIFLFAAYFQLRDRLISFSESRSVLPFRRVFIWPRGHHQPMRGCQPRNEYILDFVNMATYHVCVLIWFYYLLVPQKDTCEDLRFLCPRTISTFGTGNWSVSYTNDSGHHSRHRRRACRSLFILGITCREACRFPHGASLAGQDSAHRRRSLSQSRRSRGGRLSPPPLAGGGVPLGAARTPARHGCLRSDCRTETLPCWYASDRPLCTRATPRPQKPRANSWTTHFCCAATPPSRCSESTSPWRGQTRAWPPRLSFTATSA